MYSTINKMYNWKLYLIRRCAWLDTHKKYQGKWQYDIMIKLNEKILKFYIVAVIWRTYKKQ